MYNVCMQIEIEELVATKNYGFLWDSKKLRGLDGGEVKVTLNNGKAYSFSVQDFVEYVVHRGQGKGFAKRIKK